MAKVAIGLNDLSAAERKAVLGYKRTVLSLAEDFGAFRKKASQIAPDLIALFNRMVSDRPAGSFGLADFARIYDESVPTHAGTNKDGDEGYRVHKTYMAIDYMRRSLRRGGGRQGVFNPQRAKLERMIATLLTIAKDPEPLWAAIGKVFGMPARSLATLKNRVADAEPILDLSAIIKPVKLEAAVIGPVAPPAAGRGAVAAASNVSQLQAGMDALGRKGTRVTVGGRRKAA